MRRYQPAGIRLPLVAAAALAAAAFAAAAAPRDPGAQSEPPAPRAPLGEFEHSVAVPWVMVPVVVRGPQGYVRDLGRDDFRLFVDGEPVGRVGAVHSESFALDTSVGVTGRSASPTWRARTTAT